MPTLTGWILISLAAAWIVLGAIAAGHALCFKRDPRSAALWVLISVTLPLVGAWLYWALGINRVERKAVRKLGRRERPFDAAQVLEAFQPSAFHEAVGHLHPLRTVADRVTRLPLLPGNAIEPLHNGEQAYPRMLGAITDAKHSVTLASYIFDWDVVGREFAEALGDAARRGVQVHALLDGIGALESFSRIGRLLLKSGARVEAFVPLRFPLGRVRFNLRNHRKTLVVDGRTAFTGGMNISARHLVARCSPRCVEDLHFEIAGPVVAEIQHTFAEDWALATGDVLQGEDYFPNLPPAGSALCRGISSGPDADFEIIHWILLAALSAAQRSVWIVTPYFVPSASLISALEMAALRGVEITLLLPSVVDLPFMRWVADAYLWQLLKRGIRVLRQPPPFTHTKLLVVDERWVLLGSANLDPRSLRLNFEFNVEAYDSRLAYDMCRWLGERIAASHEVTLAEMDARPLWRRLRDGTVKMFSPHL